MRRKEKRLKFFCRIILTKSGFFSNGFSIFSMNDSLKLFLCFSIKVKKFFTNLFYILSLTFYIYILILILRK